MSDDAMSDAAAAFEALLRTPYGEPLPAEQELHSTVLRYAEEGGDLDVADGNGYTLTAIASESGRTGETCWFAPGPKSAFRLNLFEPTGCSSVVSPVWADQPVRLLLRWRPLVPPGVAGNHLGEAASPATSPASSKCDPGYARRYGRGTARSGTARSGKADAKITCEGSAGRCSSGAGSTGAGRSPV